MATTRKQPYLSWTFAGYEQFDRGTMWYLGAGTIVGLAMLYSLLTANYLFAVLVFMAMAVIFLQQIYLPPSQQCHIDVTGITIGDDRYPFSTIREFWIVSRVDGKSKLYFRQARGLQSIVSAPLEEVDPEEVRSFLGEFVQENQEYTNEPLDDWVGRVLKL